MCNLSKLGLDRSAGQQEASGGFQLKAEGEIRLGRGKEKVKAGAPNPPRLSPESRISSALSPKINFPGLGVAGSGRRLLSAVLTRSPTEPRTAALGWAPTLAACVTAIFLMVSPSPGGLDNGEEFPLFSLSSGLV